MGNDRQTDTVELWKRLRMLKSDDSISHPLSEASELWKRLRTQKLDAYISRNEKNFVDNELLQHLAALLAAKKCVRANVIERGGIEASYGQSIFRGTRHPSRDKVLQLAIGFPLTVDEAQRTLLIAHKRQLHPRIKRDAALIFVLNENQEENDQMTFADVQLLLTELGLPPLGDEPD